MGLRLLLRVCRAGDGREREKKKKESRRKSCPQTREDIFESHTYIFINQSQNVILPVVESMQSWWKHI